MPVAQLNYAPSSVIPTVTGHATDSLSESSLRGDNTLNAPMPHFDNLVREYEILSIAAPILLSIQAQILFLSIFSTRSSGESTPIRAVNAIYLGGLIIDAMAGMISFSASRWLHHLTRTEKLFLEYEFEWQQGIEEKTVKVNPIAFHLSRKLVVNPGSTGRRWQWLDHRLAISFFATSLSAPLPMLYCGSWCLVLGTLIYTWSEHSVGVGIVVSLVFLFALPFLLGVLLIGRETERRKRIITTLSVGRPGSW